MQVAHNKPLSHKAEWYHQSATAILFPLTTPSIQATLSSHQKHPVAIYLLKSWFFNNKKKLNTSPLETKSRHVKKHHATRKEPGGERRKEENQEPGVGPVSTLPLAVWRNGLLWRQEKTSKASRQLPPQTHTHTQANERQIQTHAHTFTASLSNPEQSECQCERETENENERRLPGLVFILGFSQTPGG